MEKGESPTTLGNERYGIHFAERVAFEQLVTAITNRRDGTHRKEPYKGVSGRTWFSSAFSAEVLCVLRGSISTAEYAEKYRRAR